MFKVAAVKKLFWPVIVNIPQDGGRTQKQEFEAEFEIPGQDEHDEFIGAGGDVIKRYSTGNFKGVKDETGAEDLPNGEETKTMLLNISYVRNGMLLAFYQALGGKNAQRKN